LPGIGAAQEGSGPSLVERLGYPADARVVIFTADEFGETHAANVGVMKCWEAGFLKSVTWLAPAPWAPEALEYIRKQPGMDVGVHLTLTGPVGVGRGATMGWRPLLSRAEVPGLYAPEGYFWPRGIELWKHATPDEVKREAHAQIEKALQMGIDPTHLDPHDGLFGPSPGRMSEFAQLYAELGREFSLPVRVPYTRARLVAMGQTGVRATISKLGVLMNDEGVMLAGRDSYRQMFRQRIPGTLTEIYIHPAIECPEIKTARAAQNWWKEGVDQLQLFTDLREELGQAIKEEGFIVIGWREIRNLQRRGG
jgi:predicted glycoside hydrolase/deacetylase ChbG (UPF0249 family)